MQVLVAISSTFRNKLTSQRCKVTHGSHKWSKSKTQPYKRHSYIRYIFRSKKLWSISYFTSHIWFLSEQNLTLSLANKKTSRRSHNLTNDSPMSGTISIPKSYDLQIILLHVILSFHLEHNITWGEWVDLFPFV